MRSPSAIAILGLAVIAAGPAACAAGNTAANAAIGTGLAVAAAGINRAATGECWASCRPGTVCDKATGLCVEPGSRSKAPSQRAAALVPAAGESPGHEYVVPPAEAAECSCPPGEACDAGPRECAFDGGAPVSH